MIFQTDRIISDVRVTLDQNRVDTALLTGGDEDTLRLDELIESKIVEAVRRVHSAAPYHLLDSSTMTTNVLWESENQCGYTVLPDDFLRLVVFKMSDWEIPVYQPISALDPLYAKQRSRFKGLRGTAQRPVVAIVRKVIQGSPHKVLEFYSSKTTEALVELSEYMPIPTITTRTISDTTVNVIDISQRCYDAVVYTDAALVLASMGEAENATRYFELAKTTLEQ